MSALDQIRHDGVVAIIREPTPSEAASLLSSYIDAGLHAVEVSLVTPDALEVVKDAVARAPHGVHIGVGTVLTPHEALAAAASGASFIVSPTWDESVIRAALESGMDVLPGVATPTEALLATRAGATAVKLFPASLWTPASLRDVRSAMPWLETVPTGGVRLDSVGEWIRSGAMAVGLGSALTGGESTGERIAGILRDVQRAKEAAR